MKRIATLVLALSAVVPSFAKSEVPPCRSGEEAQRILKEQSRLSDECGQSAECWEKHRSGLESALDRALELCPSQVGAVLGYQLQVDDESFWRERLPLLRASVEEADAADVHDAYPQLWSLEFKLTAPVEHDRLRGRVATDLERLASLELWHDETWIRGLATGYQLIGDDEKLSRLADEILKRRPCDAVSGALERWREEHPAPGPSASEEERTAHKRRLIETTREWTERCPESFWAAENHFIAVTALDSVSEEELIEAGERYAAAWKELSASTGAMFPSPYHHVAEAYLGHGLAERAPELVEKALAEMRAVIEKLSAADEQDSQYKRMAEAAMWVSRSVLAEVHVERGEIDAARHLLLELEEELEGYRPEEGASTDHFKSYSYLAGRYWHAAADLAEREGRRLDAVAFLLKTHQFGAGKQDEPLDRARELWRELGGTDEGWQSFALGDLEAANPSGWKERGEPLVAFALTDLAGRTWTLEELRGKRVFANLWATWCGPCREELPLVQDLYRRLQGNDGVVVVTLNLDQNPGLVAPYMKKSEFSFPVLLALDWVESNDIPMAIPRNWIIDGEGLLVKEQVGFNMEASAEEWVGDVLEQLASLTPAGGS